MPKETEAQRKPNDDLLVMSHDGDLYIDPNVRQEMGLLISDRNQWALPPARAAPFYEFRRPDQQPVKSKAMFVYRADPPRPDDDAMVMNRVLRAVNSMAERDRWRPWKPFSQRASQWKYLAFMVLTCAVGYMGWSSYEEQRTIRTTQLRIEEYRATLRIQPTGEGALTDEQIETLLSAQDNPQQTEPDEQSEPPGVQPTAVPQPTGQGAMSDEEIESFMEAERQRRRQLERQRQDAADAIDSEVDPAETAGP